MRTILLVALLASAAASAQIFPGNGGGGGVTPTDVQAALVGQAINASSYTATSGTTGFQCTGDPAVCLRYGTAPRATLGVCTAGSPDLCVGPNDFGFTSKLTVWGDITSQTLVARTFIDLQGSAYLINNSGAVTVTDADGLVINGTSAMKGVVRTAVTYDAAAITNNACSVQSVTVAGAAVGDTVSVSADFSLPQGVGIGNVRVTAANTVELTLCNVTTGGTLDPASGTYRFRMER
jgi:hypothetical protein